MKYFSRLLLFLLPFGCACSHQNQGASSSTSTKPVLHAPVDATAFPTGPIDFTRSVPDSVAGRLQADFEKGVDATKMAFVTMPGVDSAKLAFAVELYDYRHGHWSAVSGLTPGSPERWWPASVTKMITGAVILQMIECGDLALTDKLDRFLPAIPNASLITIDDLLRHTSGLYSFNGDPEFRADQRYYTPEELIAISTRHGPGFPPGTSWSYSNTGYVVLARVAETIDGKPFADIVTTRIAEPFGLTQFGIQEANSAHPLVSAASSRPPSTGEIASLSGAGGLTASPRDILVFLHAYLTGQIVSTPTLTRAFEKLHPMNDTPFFFGRGVMVFDVPDAKRSALWLGHSGGSPDAKALAVYDVHRRAFIVVTINAQAPAEALANSLLKTLDDDR